MARIQITEEDFNFYIQENYYDDEEYMEKLEGNRYEILEVANEFINEGDTRWANIDDLVFPCLSDAIEQVIG